MSNLVLVKTPVTFTLLDGSNPCQGEQVVGIAAPNSRTILEYGHRLTGEETEEELGLNDYAAGKLVEFYTRCHMAAPEVRPFYNCHLLAWFITGKVADLQRYDNYHSTPALPVASTALEPNKTYAIETATGDLNHSLVGIERPGHSLSVLGDYSPLAIIDNTGLMSFYGGVAIKQITPKSASFST